MTKLNGKGKALAIGGGSLSVATIIGIVAYVLNAGAMIDQVRDNSEFIELEGRPTVRKVDVLEAIVVTELKNYSKQQDRMQVQLDRIEDAVIRGGE